MFNVAKEVNVDDDFMLTTFDNPFNPFTDFIRWWKEDLQLGHDCCGLLARESNTSDLCSEEFEREQNLKAMKRIVEEEPMIYCIVKRESFEPLKAVSS